MAQSMVGAMDPYRGSLHRVCTLMVPLLAQMCEWVLATEQRGQGAAEITSKGVFLIFLKTSIPDALIP